ncbi:MAG: hypothetical protein LWX54_15000 [Deltaproteobacteria bacterium]|nr:hypothetical protein [Desulfobacterales bacterium]MDL1985463.1 hypothetical protein [Deltaproteobacteria bacterium]
MDIGNINFYFDSKVDPGQPDDIRQGLKTHFRIGLGITDDDVLAPAAQQLVYTNVVKMAAIRQIDKLPIL